MVRRFVSQREYGITFFHGGASDSETSSSNELYLEEYESEVEGGSDALSSTDSDDSNESEAEEGKPQRIKLIASEEMKPVKTSVSTR